MSTNIYVGNLSYNITDDQLKSVFEEYGEVISAKVITDRDTGRAKGFAFVEMANQQDAEKAIKELDGGELDGRNIKVNLSQPKTKKSNNDRRNRW